MHVHSVLLLKGRVIDKNPPESIEGFLEFEELGRFYYDKDLLNFQEVSINNVYFFKLINVLGNFGGPDSVDGYILSYMDDSIVVNPDDIELNSISIQQFSMLSLGTHACSPDTKLVVDPNTLKPVVKSFKCNTNNLNYIEMDTFSDKDNPIPSPYISYYECDDAELKRINDKIGIGNDKINFNTKWSHDDIPTIVDLRSCNLGVKIVHRLVKEI